MLRAFATALILSPVEALISITPLALGPTAILSIYISGAWSKQPLGATANTEIAFGSPLATDDVPSNGSTAISTFKSSAVAVPICSPIYNIGASSISPSPITTIPSIFTVSNIRLIASTAAWSAAFLSPCPKNFALARAAASVTLPRFTGKFLSILTSPIYLFLPNPLRSFRFQYLLKDDSTFV